MELPINRTAKVLIVRVGLSWHDSRKVHELAELFPITVRDQSRGSHQSQNNVSIIDTGDNTHQSVNAEEFQRILKNKELVLSFSQNLRSEGKHPILRRIELIPTFKNFNLQGFSVRLCAVLHENLSESCQLAVGDEHNIT